MSAVKYLTINAALAVREGMPEADAIRATTINGVVFAACFLRNNSIWPVIIMHAAVDLAGGLRHISLRGTDQIPVANNTY